jgi:hypothetical protein
MRREVVRPGDKVVHTTSGSEIHRRPNGELRDVHASGMDIHHGTGGARTVRVVRADHSVIVVNRGGRGYLERPYTFNNQVLVHRTYYVNGVAYARIYRPYTYRGIAVNMYMPSRYYAPAFYGWAYAPWGAPVAYRWGWAGTPWYGYYGDYFTPYPVYASPSLWLTDYVLSATLQSAYEERMAAAAENAPAHSIADTPLTPAVKQAIADEVHRQIGIENTESQTGLQTPPDPGSSGIGRMLSDNSPHVFVVSSALDVTSAGKECPITEGDVLQLDGPPPPAATSADLVVLASKGLDCRRGGMVSVGLADLQDMQNHMRETIDQGLVELQSKQGKSGLPALPAAAVAPPVETRFAATAPPPDPQIATELRQQAQEADKTEQDTLREASVQNTAAATPATPAAIALGQTPDQVKAILGTPVTVVDLGEKKIYVYKNLKVTFTAGKLSDVQ